MMTFNLRDTTNNNGVHHGSWCIPGWIWHLLCHVKNDIECDERESGLQKAQDPGHAVGPTSLIIEVREDKLCTSLV